MKKTTDTEPKVSQRSLDVWISSAEELIKEATEYSNKQDLNSTERETAFYYYLLKCFLAIYESCFGAIPVQIFNEHRMALDHFIRAKMNDDSLHYNKAIGHLCRALLDVIKLNCDGLRKKTEKRHSEIPIKAVGMVSNGEYIKNYVTKQNEAERILTMARIQDSNLGKDAYANLDVVNGFITAFFAHKEWNKFQENEQGNILFIKAKYYGMKGISFATTLFVGFVVGIAANTFTPFFRELIKKVIPIMP